MEEAWDDDGYIECDRNKMKETKLHNYEWSREKDVYVY